MRVLVSYLGRNQIFSLEKDDTKSQMRDLKQKISSYFEIANTMKFILQRYDNEWDSYIDLGEEDTLEDRDKLWVMSVLKSKESEVMVIHYDYNVYVHNEHPYFHRSCPVQIVRTTMSIVISHRSMTSYQQ